MLPAPDKTLRERLGSPEGLAVFWLELGSPSLLELSLRARPDAIVLDQQHGLWSRGLLEVAVAAACPMLVRVKDGSAASIGQALDAGAEGVLVPLVETAEETASVIAAAHYPPRGRRSAGGIRPLGGDFAAYIETARRQTTVGVMLETVAAVANAQAIAETPGLDFVFIGTGDLALSIGCSSPDDPHLEEACRTVLAACRSVGVPCGIFTEDAARAAARIRDGYSMVVLADDIDVITSGFAGARSAFAAATAVAP